MFGVYFGKYLQDKGVLTDAQYDEVMSESRNTKVKMGLLAVEAGYMTEAQAKEVNTLQQKQDKRFGDIAVEKGYLTDDQVVDLLEKQGDGYLLFVQSLIEHNILTLEEIQAELNAFKKAEHYSAKDIEAIKSGDIDRIALIFMKDEAIPPLVKEYIALSARNMVRFVDRYVRMEKVEIVTEYTSGMLGGQEITGDHDVFTCFGGEGIALKTIAEGFADFLFEQIDMDVVDATCEFLNCNNGLYATKLSHRNIEIDMKPPILKDELSTVHGEGNLYKIPFYVNNARADLIICIDTAWTLD